MINCSPKATNVEQNLEQVVVSEDAININKVSAQELEKLPHIGAKTAAQIIEHRRRFGDFRRPEHLLLVSGVSDKRFRKMRSMIKVK